MRATRLSGMASVIAMLYLVLFATLAIGFYAATNTATQVTANDERIARAFLAGESGMDFMRYQLANVHIPPNTPSDAVLDALYTDLQAALNGTPNLKGGVISRNGNVVRIPADANSYIPTDANGGSGFRATITEWAGEIVVKSEGRYGGTEYAARAITMDFTRQQHTTSVFDYAIASKGQVVISKGKVTSTPGVDPRIAAVMSASPTPSSVTVGATVGGDISYVAGGSAMVSGGASVGGSNNLADIMANHTHEVEEPEFPTIDTTVYRPYAVNTYGPGVPLVNLRIPAGTNKKFAGNQTIQGILYIESPNQIEFQGDVNLQGFIVFEPATPGDSLKFTGNLTMSPVPNQPQFDAVRATTGVAILAPGANVLMTGSAGGNVKGNIITKTFTFKGASDLIIDQGTIMTLSDAANSFVMDSSKSIRFTATGAHNQPSSGVSYSTFFAPVPSSYQEVAP